MSDLSKKIRNLTFLFILTSLTLSCARIVTPIGGEKDLIPPKVLSCSPKANSTNFKSKEIKIDFDEYIVLDNASQKLLISPPLRKKPTISSKLKSLYIKDLDSLQENTTYIIDLSDAVTDYTEGNRIKHFTYSFSTGNEIDSLTCKGRVLNAFTFKPEPDKYVALYSDKSKSAQTSTIPVYLTRTDSLGYYFFDNIRQGDYSLLCYEDDNNSLTYDLPTEGIGFLSERILAKQTTDSTLKPDTVFFCPARDTVRKIDEAKFSADKEIEVKLSFVASDSLTIDLSPPQALEKDYLISKILTDTNTTIKIYLANKKNTDTVNLILSDQNGFKEKSLLIARKDKKKKGDKHEFTINTQSSPHYYDRLCLNVPFPIESTCLPLHALLIENGDSTLVDFDQDSSDFCKLVSSKVLKEDCDYVLQVDSSLLTNLRSEHNKALNLQWHSDKKDDYSSFEIVLKDSLCKGVTFLLTLIDDKGNPLGGNVLSCDSVRRIRFEHLPEGGYKLRAITDLNNNSKWDPNDFQEHRQAERVQFFSKAINIRKGWDLEEEWQICP